MGIHTAHFTPPVDTVLDSILNIIAVAAQPDSDKYRWGQSVRTQDGDNLSQYGLHGTAQAVIALSQKNHLRTHFSRFLIGGRAWLAATTETPKKTADVSKTLKQSELLTALTMAKADIDTRANIIRRLQDCFDRSCSAWHFETGHQPIGPCHPAPTLYAIRALRMQDTLFNSGDSFQPQLRAAAGAAFEMILDKSGRERHALACLYVFSLDDALCTGGFFEEHGRRLMELFGSSPALPSDLKDIYKLDYQFAIDGTQTEHAFATLPFGLLDLWCRLWFCQHSIEAGVWAKDYHTKVNELVTTLLSRRDTQFSLVEEYALSAQIFARFGDMLLAPALTPVQADAPHVEADSTPNESVHRSHFDDYRKAKGGILVAIVTAAYGAGIWTNDMRTSSKLNSLTLQVEQMTYERGLLQRDLNGRASKEAFLTLMNRYYLGRLSGDSEVASDLSKQLDSWLAEQSDLYKTTSTENAAAAQGVEIISGAQVDEDRLRFPFDGSEWPITWR